MTSYFRANRAPHRAAPRSPSLALATALLGLFAACQTQPPVKVQAQVDTAPALAQKAPADIAVLPVEDGTSNAAASRLLVFLRQEVMRQLPDRLYSPLTATVVDAALRTQPGAVEAAGGRLTPATLQKLAGHSSEDALFALRVERWDEAYLLTERRVGFQFQAVMMASDGTQLWNGTIQGEVKAGGAGVAPRDRDGMARSCAELAVRELMQHLPRRAL